MCGYVYKCVCTHIYTHIYIHMYRCVHIICVAICIYVVGLELREAGSGSKCQPGKYLGPGLAGTAIP